MQRHRNRRRLGFDNFETSRVTPGLSSFGEIGRAFRFGAEMAKDEEKPIVFQATVAKVQTMVDGGLRVVFDLPETAIAQVGQLMECKRKGVVLKVKVERG